MSSLFVAIEGTDCSGVSTQIDLLATRLLRTNGHEVHTREFPCSWILHAGLDLATNGLTCSCIRIADRYAAVPAMQSVLRRAGIVIVGAWKTCELVIGVRDGMEEKWLADALYSLIEPDIYILLDVEPETAVKRLRGSSRFSNSLSAQKRLVERYRQLWKTSALAPGASRHWQIVDGEKSIEEVHESVFQIVSRELIVQGF